MIRTIKVSHGFLWKIILWGLYWGSILGVQEVHIGGPYWGSILEGPVIVSTQTNELMHTWHIIKTLCLPYWLPLMNYLHGSVTTNYSVVEQSGCVVAERSVTVCASMSVSISVYLSVKVTLWCWLTNYLKFYFCLRWRRMIGVGVFGTEFVFFSNKIIIVVVIS